MLINCFSISSTDQLDLVYVLLNSLKTNKQIDTVIHYFLLLDLTKQKNMQYCQKYFQPLLTNSFKIDVVNISSLLNYIDKNLKPPYYTYLKCYAPQIFQKLDKILYLDTDMIFHAKGVEQLWNINISRYYCAAVEEPYVTYLMKQELENTKTKNYFNAGVMLLNLKKIRKDKIDEELVSMLTKWDFDKVKPDCADQTLFNYIFKQKVKFLDYKFNNTILIATPQVIGALSNFLNQKYGRMDVGQSLQQAVIYHFLGDNKPWKENVRKLTTEKKHFSFKRECINIWDSYYNLYKNTNPIVEDNKKVNADLVEYHKNKKIYFITRVSRLKNLELIQTRLKKLLKNKNIDYQHILLFDLTVLNEQQINFQQFSNQKTTIYKVPWKQTFDKYMYYNVDEVIQRIKEKDCWIYILDDDNLLLKKFTILENELDNNYPVTVFNVKTKDKKANFNGIIKEPLISGRTLFHIDVSNFIVHKSVFDRCKFGNKRYSAWSDGIFMQRVLKEKYPIKYIHEFLSHYNGM